MNNFFEVLYVTKFYLINFYINLNKLIIDNQIILIPEITD